MTHYPIGTVRGKWRLWRGYCICGWWSRRTLNRTTAEDRTVAHVDHRWTP